MKKIFLTTLGYIITVFPLAYIWHLVLFKDKYQSFGYFTGEPNIPLGFASIIIQGLVLSILYPYFYTGKTGIGRAFQFAVLVGIFYWTCHVLAHVAKQDMPNAAGYIVMESGYLSLQFGLFALVLSLVYRDTKS